MRCSVFCEEFSEQLVELEGKILLEIGTLLFQLLVMEGPTGRTYHR